MRFAEHAGRHLRRRTVMAALWWGAGLVAVGCATGFEPLSNAPVPQSIRAVALRAGAVRVSWQPVTDAAIVSYVIERRVDFTGAFQEVARVPETFLGELAWIDTDVEPGRVYGYRVSSITTLGDRSVPSLISGAQAPPRPGIELSTNTSAVSAVSFDPDGYEILIAGPDTVRGTLGVQTTRTFSPLRPGRYTVTLSGVVARCAVVGSSSTNVDVTDTSATTIAPISFNVSCRDPNRGEFAVVIATSGANIDPTFTVDVLGQVTDTTLPTAQRVYSAQRLVPAGSAAPSFTNLLPGSYTVTLKDVAANCAVQGTAARTLTITPLLQATVNYAVACTGPTTPQPAPSTVGTPYVWRTRWSPKTAPTGASVVLEATLDLSARPGKGVTGAQAEVTYDPAVLRYDGRTIGDLDAFTVNAAVPGVVSFVAFTTDAARTGVVSLGKFRFTVLGATGTRSLTLARRVTVTEDREFQDSVRFEQDTLQVGAAVPSQVNQPPVANAGGPYTGVAGTPVAFSSAGSSDPDGTIAAYAWQFGDGATSTLASPARTYAAAGTYTARLTITDNLGATATASAVATIAAATTTPPPTPTPTPTPAPAAIVAKPNGPYTVVAGTPLTLSSAGTTGATSFSWTLGNGAAAVTGPSPTVTYATPGVYTVTLTASSGSASATATTTVTVTAAPAPPVSSTTTLPWRNTFDPIDVANNTVTVTVSYDLRTNLPETPGQEALESFSVDSLKWNASQLQFLSMSLGPGIVGTVNQAGAAAGTLAFRGTLALQQGLRTIATIRFRPVGAAGQTVTTRTFLGRLLGPASTSSFVYNPKTTVIEGTFTLP